MSKTAVYFWLITLFYVQNAAAFLFPVNCPAILLAGVLFFAMHEGPGAGWVFGMAAGFLAELLSTGRFGLHMVLYGAAGFIGGSSSSAIFRDGIFSKSLLPAVLDYGMTLAGLAFSQAVLQYRAPDIGLIAEAFMPGRLFMTALFSPFIFRFLRRIFYGRYVHRKAHLFRN